MIKTIQMSLISPAMIGGAEARKLDEPHVLRPSSIRGMLRFWIRALAGGASLNIHKEESTMWGDTTVGQAIAILPGQIFLPKTKRLFLFPHKSGGARVSSEMLSNINSNVALIFKIPVLKTLNYKKFQAVIWIWLHLGAIGRRSRRGYGSLLWQPQTDDILQGFTEFNPTKDLSSEKNLTKYLLQGLTKVKSVWSVPDSSPRGLSPFFQLKSIDQVFVGKILEDSGSTVLTDFDNSANGILYKIHGLNEISSGPREELGHAGQAPWLTIPKQPPRNASPMIWRLFPCAGGYVPVMTWAPRTVTSITSGNQVYDYLTRELRLSNSLAGNSI